MDIPHQRGTFLMIDEPTLTHYCLEFMVYTKGHSWCFTFYEIYKCTMTCIHHHTIIQKIFTALKSSVLHPFTALPQYILASTNIFTASIVFPFPECRIVGVIQYVPFQIGFFHLVRCISSSCMSFNGMIAQFFLALNSIPLSGCSTVYFSIHYQRASWFYKFGQL